MDHTRDQSPVLNPAPILALSTGYWNSQTLLTANRIGLFAKLHECPMTLKQVSNQLEIREKGALMLLNACIALKLVEESEGIYRNTSLSTAFLSPGKQSYLGDALCYSDDLYATWGELEKSLKTGEPAVQTESYTGSDVEQTINFVYGMHNRALGIGRILVDMVNLTGRKKMIDVGGGPGTYSALFAQKYDQLNSQVLDLPGVVKIADEIIESMGVSSQVSTLSLDYMKDDLPSGNDVVLISGVFHRESEQTCIQFIKSAYQALDPGGLLIVSDVFTDDGGQSPLFATLFGLNMMLTAKNGCVHSDQAVAGWMKDQSFIDIQKKSFPAPMPHRIVTGIKP